MADFELTQDLRIGHIVEVKGTSIRIEIDGAVTELTRSYNGRVYPIGQIGSVVKINFGRRIVFGFVTLLRMRSEDLIDQGKPIPPDADQRLMEIELFAEGSWNAPSKKLKFTRGVSTYPLPRQAVYLLTKDESLILYQSAEGQQASNDISALVPFGTYAAAESAPCRANIDKMFGMHCAILGSTGSGKSAAVAALLHSVLEHRPNGIDICRPRITIIDPHGEYGKAFGTRATVFRAYDPIGNEESEGVVVSLPYWLMSADEFRSLAIGKTEFEATTQNNVIYKALTHARMAYAGLVEPAPTSYGGVGPTDGSMPDEPRPKSGISPEQIAEFDRDKPRPFSLKELVNHIIYLQGARVKGAILEKIPEGDFAKKFKSVLDKISILRRDPRISFLMREIESHVPLLSEILGQFVGNHGDSAATQADIRILDISGLPNEVAGPLAAMLARLLFQYKLYQSADERKKDPLLLVCEEAHRYVPDRGEAEYAAAQAAVRRIAREGRKYGIGLMLVSQRPADVESTVISQCGTWLVLRLTNQTDQQHVAKFLPDGLAGMTRSLSTLAQQEAIFVGEGASIPAKVRIKDLTLAQLPRSQNAKYAEGWSGPRLTDVELEAVARRMMK